MGVNSFSYTPIVRTGEKFPLENFISPLPEGAVPSWVEENNLSNHLLVDPISANPLLPVELAASGYRVLCARSNPIIWLITEVAASAPSKEEFTTVVNNLLNTRDGKETLYDSLQELYLTPCANCGKMIQAEGFIWEKEKSLPVSRVYNCQFCGDDGEKPISEYDLSNLVKLGKLSIHRSRAFHRIGSGNEYEQNSINSALDCYLPRALYVCMLLVNRLDQISMNKDQLRILRAVLLTVFNDAHSLRHWPIRNHRFLQLTLPNKFFETNLLLSIQSANKYWGFVQKKINISYWPNLPSEEGGICFFQRKLTDNKQIIPENSEIAITTVFPRPGQSFWTFSALWSGWLWGKKAVIPMRSALSRRRYDWFWFTKAVNIAFRGISPSIKDNSLVFGLLPQFTPSLSYGLFAGMNSNDFSLTGCAYRLADKLLQCQWKKQHIEANQVNSDIDLKKFLIRFLETHGEPVIYQRIIMQAMIRFVMENGIPRNLSDIKEADLTRFQNVVNQIVTESGAFEPYPSDLPGGSRWWLINEKKVKKPISERIEENIRNQLISTESISLQTIDKKICKIFTGSHTPKKELIETITKSYADQLPGSHDLYKLRSGEFEASRENELQEITTILKKIGKTNKQSVFVDNVISWSKPSSNTITYIFYPTITAEISQFIFNQELNDISEHVIVFPGSRSALISYRIKNDPRFEQYIEQGWHFLKFRYLRRLAKKDDMKMEAWKNLLDSDPPLWEPPTQLQII